MKTRENHATMKSHGSCKTTIFLGALTALSLGAAQGAHATVIAPGAADFAYEGNDIPAGGGWDGFTDTQTGSGWAVADTATGGVWTRNVSATGNPSTEFMFARKDSVVNSLTFTIDWRVARPVITENTIFQADGPNLDLRADIDGLGGEV